MELLSVARDRRRSWRLFGSGFALGLIIAITLAAWAAIVYWPRPGPPGEVIVAPNSEQERQAETVIVVRPAGEVTATITRQPAAEEKPAQASGAGLPAEESHEPPAAGQAAGGKPAGWEVGDRAEAPMTGALEARVVDKRSGEELGVAEVAIAGSIEAYFVDPGRLELRGEFAAEPVTIAINRPLPAPNRAGVMYSSAGGLAAYYRHDWLLVRAGRVDVLAWARVAIGQDVREIAAGIEAAF